jgi:poly-gamma-glutamate synthesis protein (capsule biosynthesis protein)
MVDRVGDGVGDGVGDPPDRSGPTYRLALTGDVIMNSRVSTCRDRDVLDAIGPLRDADVACAHLEIPLHDFEPDVFPAAEGALSWMRGPSFVAEELAWCGIDAVSTASNHSLDYSHGGMARTLDALDRAGIAHAGTGADLAVARAPAFVDAAVGRIALVSATSSFPAFARAGAVRTDAPGRPGVNPLRYLHVVGPALADQLIGIVSALGLWVVRNDDEFVIHPPGTHNSVWRFRVSPDVGERPTTACDNDDLTGNLESIAYARSVSDFVLAHLHVHAWDGVDGRMSTSPGFVHEFAHAAVGAGAGLVLVQGSHAPMRGIEVLDSVPILYDPGPLFRLGRREPQPHDFYSRWGNAASVSSFDATLLDAFTQRDQAMGGGAGGKTVVSPREGVHHEPGFVLPVCEVDTLTHRVARIELHPMTWSRARRSTTGFPVRAEPARAAAIIDRLAELSAPYGVTVSPRSGLALVTL